MKKTLKFQAASIGYTVTGTGNPVMLVHGFGEDSRIWDSITPALSSYKLIIPDLPGSGKSAMLEHNVGLEDYAACLKAILEEERISSVVMVGHSMGGYTTLAFAAKYPEMLKAAGLFHSSSYADDEEKKATRHKAIDFIKNNGAKAFLDTSIPGLFYKSDHPAIKELLQRGSEFSPEALIQYYKAMIARPDRTEILKQLKIPFLFIMGEHDKAVPFEHSLTQSQLPDLSYVYILRESGHMGMLEETEKATEGLIKFLQDIYV